MDCEKRLTSDEVGKRWGKSARFVNQMQDVRGLKREGRRFLLKDVKAFEKKHPPKNFYQFL